MKKISTTLLAIAIAMMLFLSNTYAASNTGGSSSDSAGSGDDTTSGTGSGTSSGTASGTASGSAATSGTNNVAPTRICNGIWKPSPGMPWMWEIGVVPSNSVLAASNAQVVDLDMFLTPISTINYIHSLGKAMICYIDTQYEPDRPDSAQFTAAVKGSPIEGWPGQVWVNISSPIVRTIMLNRAKLAQSKGCDAIEWDDVDGFANNNGFKTTAAEQISFNTYLASMTHSLGMSVGLKNNVGQIADLVNYFDWALNEQCLEFSECSGYSAFIKQGKAVFGTEYPSSTFKTAPATFCPTQNKAGFSWLSSDLALDGKNTVQCCSFNKPACAGVTYQCTNANGTTTYAAPANAQSEGLPSSASSSSVCVLGLVVASFFLALLL